MTSLPRTMGGKADLKEKVLNKIYLFGDKSIIVSHFHWQNSGVLLAENWQKQLQAITGFNSSRYLSICLTLIE